jgi:hypothetical protein
MRTIRGDLLQLALGEEFDAIDMAATANARWAKALRCP